jgi:hypothetical protein
VPEDALLTLLLVESGEQHHFLLPARGQANTFCRFLVECARDMHPENARQSMERTIEKIRQFGGQPLKEHELEVFMCRYLITFSSQRCRILVSAWSRQDASSHWQRLWLPRQIHLAVLHH